MTLALGILFIILKGEVVSIGITVLGVALIVTSIIDLCRKSFVGGAIKAILGIAVLVIGWTLIDIAILVLGIVLLVYGIFELVKRLTASKKGQKAWAIIIGLIEPIVCIVASVLLIKNGTAVVGLTIVIAGILFVVDGVLALIAALGSKK